MSKNLKTFSIFLITMSAAVGMAQYEDRFDGTTSSNWLRESLLDLGSAEWSISGGRMNFFTGSSPTSDNQVLIKYQNPFSNSQDWSFQIGMNNASTAQLQVFVGNANYSDYFGVTLKGYANGSRVWGAEFPGHHYWVPPSGIMATASQQGSIKVDYASSTGTYYLFYANGGMDPISNSYSWTLLNSYVTSERGNVDFYAGINTGETVANGQAYVDNFKAIPEPSVLSLGMLGLAGLVMLRSRRRILVMVAISAIFFLDREANATPLYVMVDPNLSHQLVTVQNNSPGAYSFKISINATSLNDWLLFINSKAQTSDTYNLFKTSDFSRTQSNGTYSYSLLNTSSGNNPVRSITLYDAYRYANWVENGANSSADTENGVYDLSNLSQWGMADRSSSAKYFVQSNSEWLWGVQSINTDSNYFEWTDTPNYFYEGSTLVSNGGIVMHQTYVDGQPVIRAYADTPYRAAGFGGGEMTFRLGAVPEPSALSLLAIGLGGLAILRRRRS
jgi:hypothetical protein